MLWWSRVADKVVADDDVIIRLLQFAIKHFSVHIISQPPMICLWFAMVIASSRWWVDKRRWRCGGMIAVPGRVWTAEQNYLQYVVELNSRICLDRGLWCVVQYSSEFLFTLAEVNRTIIHSSIPKGVCCCFWWHSEVVSQVRLPGK